MSKRVPTLALCILLATAPIGAQGSCGDCNGDGPVNILDALVAAQHGVGLITITPPGASDSLRLRIATTACTPATAAIAPAMRASLPNAAV